MNKMFSVNQETCEIAKVKEITCDLKNFYLGERVVLIVDGKQITRRVYDNKESGLFVRINGCMICYYDFN